MKIVWSLFFILTIIQNILAQEYTYFVQFSNRQVDSIKTLIVTSANDTMRMKYSRYIGLYYQEINRDSSLKYTLQQLQKAQELGQKLWEADAYDASGWLLSQLKNYPLSLSHLLKARKIAEEKSTEKNIWNLSWFSANGDAGYARLTSLGFIHNSLSQLYQQMGDQQKEIQQLYEAMKIGTKIKNNEILGLVRSNLSQSYLSMNKSDSSIYFGEKALQNMRESGYKTYEGHQLKLIGEAYILKQDYTTARKYLDESIRINLLNNSTVKVPEAYFPYADIFKRTKQIDSSIYYLNKSLFAYQKIGEPTEIQRAYAALYDIYVANGNTDSSLYYLNLYRVLTDSLNQDEKDKILAYQNVAFDEQIAEQLKEKIEIKKANTKSNYILFTGITVLLIIAFLLFRNNRIRKKANELLTTQKTEIELQKGQVEKTLSELRSTQAQLIQSEKMASLGELTAGIAHEIQNPLNFVNNFSEVSKELIGELNEEVDKGNYDEVKAIAQDVVQNLEKINHHGKRADAIVKSMLAHSRTSSGKKELTNLNALAEEYLKLSYHGIKAKNNQFNANISFEPDNDLPPISIVPQEIGRVLLNLLNNAFYAVYERSKLNEPGYFPQVTLTTSSAEKAITIVVHDNGKGIPEGIREKIFQPFFTTKPTGEGTGLGLSLSYDIITKGHQGKIDLKTVEDEGTSLIITIPF